MYSEFNNYFEIDQEKCIQCGACQRVCPVNAISLTDGQMIVDSEQCAACGTCGTVCPKGAIYRHEQPINRLDFSKIDLDKLYFNPGCAVFVGKPYLPELVFEFLKKHFPTIKMHDLCCQHDPKLPEGSTMIVVCPGCDTNFNTEYEGVSAISLWELIDSMDDFQFPDHHGLVATIQDSCDYRNMPFMHDVVRRLIKKMNIEIVESKFNRECSMCCGAIFYSTLSEEEAEKKIKMRLRQLPSENVVTYCMGCKSNLQYAGKTTMHLLDLLFDTLAHESEFDVNAQDQLIEEYQATH